MALVGRIVFFKKLIDGSVSLFMQDVDTAMEKWFAMDEKSPRIGVPMNYALSIFTDATLESMLKQHVFEIENIDEVVAAAEERGFIAKAADELKEIKAPRRTKETLLAIIKGGNLAKIEELLKSADKERAWELVVQNVEQLSIQTVDKIEEITGMALREE